MLPTEEPQPQRVSPGDAIGMIVGALLAVICLSLLGMAITITQPAPVSAAVAYTPNLPPAPSAPPCEGEPWREINGDIECLDDQPLAITGTATSWTAAVWGVVILAVGGGATAWSIRTERQQAAS